ncbi:flippase [Amylibacter sp.]|nr:flippase [Amylibacter sp.]
MQIIPLFIRQRINHRPTLIKIIDNIGWLFFGQILRISIGLIIGVWIARYLGPEQFGLLSFVTAFVSIFGAISGLGLKSIVVRDIVRDPSVKNETLGTAAMLQFIGGLLAYVLITASIFWVRPDDALAKALAAILGSMLLFKASEVAAYWFESQVLSKYTVWVQNGSFVVLASIKVALLLHSAPLIAFAWAITAEALMVALLMLVMLNLRGPRLRQLSITLARAKELLVDSWPLLLSTAVLMVQARIDQIMLGTMIDDYAVAQYSVALRIVETASVCSMILHSTFMPSIIVAKKESNEAYLGKLAAFYKLNMLVAIFIALPIAMYSYPIIKVLFGSDYLAASPILALMTVRLIFAHLGVARSIYLLNENLMKYSAITMIVGTIFNIIFNYFLIPVYGGMGATATSLFSFAITIFLIDIFYLKTRTNALLMLKSAISCGSLLERRSWRF